MKFRRRVKIFPGFHLNFSNAGVSTSVGIKGASLTFGKRGTFLNTSIPGTGLYDRQRLDFSHSSPGNYSDDLLDGQVESDAQRIPGEIKSEDLNEIESSSLHELKQSILTAFKERIELKNEILIYQKKLQQAKLLRIIASIFIVGFFIKFFKNNVLSKQEYLEDLKDQLVNCKVDVDINFDEVFDSIYERLSDSFKSLCQSEKIWDVTSQVDQNAVESRSLAQAVITRTLVKFNFDDLDIIRSKYRPFHLENANGSDLFIYPAFVVITKNRTDLSLLDLKELNIEYISTKFLEEEDLPSDSDIVGTTWAKVNKNGQPDKRYRDNYQIPILLYGKINLNSLSGLNESYCFSNNEYANDFVEKLTEFKEYLM